MTAAMRLHKDACLMNTNLDILDQYALSLHGAASKILQKTIGGSPYPMAAVAAEAQGPRARRSRWRQWVYGGPLWIRYGLEQHTNSIQTVTVHTNNIDNL